MSWLETQTGGQTSQNMDAFENFIEVKNKY